MMKDKSKKEQESIVYNVDSEGSLGLLAYGDLGLRAWRKVKQKVKKGNDTNETK